jgi:hypothetical protein
MPTTDTVLGYHWLCPDMRLGYEDAREVRVGETLTVDVQPVVCQRGLHACIRAIDSLKYAPGPIVCRVRLSGQIVKGTGVHADKHSATERTCLAMADATRTMGEWACDCAERALLQECERGREPDARSWTALAVKHRWLHGEASDAELDAARDAARSAAWVAANDAARAAASAASWEAASAAASAAARDAAWEAAWDAAWEAARAAAWEAAWEAARAAARDAARDAAWEAALDAERIWQNNRLEHLLLALLGQEKEEGCATIG